MRALTPKQAKIFAEIFAQHNSLQRAEIISSAKSIITDAETKLFALYDEAALTVTGYTHILMERQSNNLLKMQSEVDDNVTYWSSIATYRILVEVN